MFSKAIKQRKGIFKMRHFLEMFERYYCHIFLFLQLSNSKKKHLGARSLDNPLQCSKLSPWGLKARMPEIEAS